MGFALKTIHAARATGVDGPNEPCSCRKCMTDGVKGGKMTGCHSIVLVTPPYPSIYRLALCSHQPRCQGHSIRVPLRTCFRPRYIFLFFPACCTTAAWPPRKNDAMPTDDAQGCTTEAHRRNSALTFAAAMIEHAGKPVSMHAIYLYCITSLKVYANDGDKDVADCNYYYYYYYYYYHDYYYFPILIVDCDL